MRLFRTIYHPPPLLLLLLFSLFVWERNQYGHVAAWRLTTRHPSLPLATLRLSSWTYPTLFPTIPSKHMPWTTRLLLSSSSSFSSSSSPTFTTNPPNDEDPVDDETPTRGSSSSSNSIADYYAKGYQTVPQEVSYQICHPSLGTIPSDLIGTYYRCGPAMFSAGSLIPPKTWNIQPKNKPVPDGQDLQRMVTHPFEGDGAIVAITFSSSSSSSSSSTTSTANDNDDDNNDNDMEVEDFTTTNNMNTNHQNQVSLRFRYVRTVGFTNERKRGQRMYKSLDTTRQLGSSAGAGLGNDLPIPLFRYHLQSGLNKNRKNTSNTRVVYWSKRLLSLWEGGLPYKVDALALSTEGKSQLGGILLEQDPFGSKMVMDPIRQHALFYRNRQDITTSQLDIFEFDTNFRLISNPKGGSSNDDGSLPNPNNNNNNNQSGNRKNDIVTVSLNGLALLSDFAATQHYVIFLQPAVTVNRMAYLWNQKEPGNILTIDPLQPSLLHIIPRIHTKNNNNNNHNNSNDNNQENKSFWKKVASNQPSSPNFISIPVVKPKDITTTNNSKNNNNHPKQMMLPDADWQFCNAYEIKNNPEDDTVNIVLDVIRPDGTWTMSSSSSSSATTSSSSTTATSWPWITTTTSSSSSSSSLDSNSFVSRPRSLWRYILNVSTGVIQEQYPLIQEYHCGFGMVHPQRSTCQHRFIYLSVGHRHAPQPKASSPSCYLQGIARYDCKLQTLDVWMPRHFEFCGEPMVAPKSKPSQPTSNNQPQQEKEEKTQEEGEEDGYILSILFNGQTMQSELLIFLSSQVSQGPMVRIPLSSSDGSSSTNGVTIPPYGHYGCFSSEAHWSPEEIQRRAKLADKMEGRGRFWNEVQSDFVGLGIRMDDIEEILGV